MDELKRLPVERMCADDCALFMWVTNPHIKAGIDIMEAWGFRYCTVFKFWSKVFPNGNPVSGVGWWSRGSVEQLLEGRRGQPLQWKTTFSEPQLYTSVRTKHSEKPKEIRESLCDFLAIPGRRIELFARSTAAQWDAWGLEIDGYLHKCDMSAISGVTLTDTSRTISTQTHGSLGETIAGVRLTNAPAPAPAVKPRAVIRRTSTPRIAALRTVPELYLPEELNPTTEPPINSDNVLPVAAAKRSRPAIHTSLVLPAEPAIMPRETHHAPWDFKEKRVTVHTEGCNCIICKQKRRRLGSAGGTSV